MPQFRLILVFSIINNGPKTGVGIRNSHCGVLIIPLLSLVVLITVMIPIHIVKDVHMNPFIV